MEGERRRGTWRMKAEEDTVWRWRAKPPSRDGHTYCGLACLSAALPRALLLP